MALLLEYENKTCLCYGYDEFGIDYGYNFQRGWKSVVTITCSNRRLWTVCCFIVVDELNYHMNINLGALQAGWRKIK